MGINQSIINSTYYGDVEDEQYGKNIIVLGETTHVDSFRKEKEYKEGIYPSFTKSGQRFI
jgi:hypothetical protein